MRRRLTAAITLVAGLSLSAQAPPFRAGVRTVAAYATVQDSTGRLVPDLEQADFQVFEDGRPRTITVFSRDPQPLAVALMLDTSQDMGGVNALSVEGGANR